jgi:hypothetical protein
MAHARILFEFDGLVWGHLSCERRIFAQAGVAPARDVG